jgi:uncharacterized protein YxeA
MFCPKSYIWNSKTTTMKKIFTLLVAALLVTGASFAGDGKCCDKEKKCCKKEGKCDKDKEAKESKDSKVKDTKSKDNKGKTTTVKA